MDGFPKGPSDAKGKNEQIKAEQYTGVYENNSSHVSTFSGQGQCPDAVGRQVQF